MKDFRNLKVWEKARALTLEVYRASGRFPLQELFGVDEPDAAMQRIHRSKHRGSLRKAGEQ
jgi:hypothetical protein